MKTIKIIIHRNTTLFASYFEWNALKRISFICVWNGQLNVFTILEGKSRYIIAFKWIIIEASVKGFKMSC